MYHDSCGSVGAAYPGDSYVDFRGFDDYEYDTQAQYDALNRQTASSKPMLLGEFGASDGDIGGGAGWLDNLSTMLRNGSLPQVQAIVYFNDGAQAFRSNPQTHAAVKALLKRAPTPPSRSC
jgi:beta-mannanase